MGSGGGERRLETAVNLASQSSWWVRMPYCDCCVILSNLKNPVLWLPKLCGKFKERTM